MRKSKKYDCANCIKDECDGCTSPQPKIQNKKVQTKKKIGLKKKSK